MNINNFGIGTDIEKISRFQGKTPENSEKFLTRIFTKKELEYCFSKKNFAQHLAARHCAKEAVVKALSELEITDVYYSDIEILNKQNGAPYANILKYPEVKIKISLSHDKDTALATAMCFTIDD